MEPRLAVFIDFENQEIKVSVIMEFLKEKGKVIFKRAYGNWEMLAVDAKKELTESGVDLIQLYPYGSQRKNRADVRLAVDAIETAFTHSEIATFVIVSGDTDLSPLIIKLKELGKYTIGIGAKRSTSDLLISNCDEFVYYEFLAGEPVQELQITVGYNLLSKAIQTLLKETDPPWNAGRLRQVMIKLDPSFSERNYGYSQFKKFLEACNEYKKTLRFAQTEAGLFISPELTKEFETTKGVDLLLKAINTIKDKPPWNGSKLKEIMTKLDPSFDERIYGYSQFKKFLEACNKSKKILELRQDEGGTLYISPAKALKL